MHRIRRRLGQLPIMVKSQACYLRHMERQELIKHREEGTEFGGYFICNGIERIIRMLIQTRRHYILGLRRSAYKKRGPSFSEYATMIRCVRPDESSITTRCHYLSNGNVVFSLVLNRAEYFLPAAVLLKCFNNVSDKEIFDKITGTCAFDRDHAGFVAERTEIMLKYTSQRSLMSQQQCIEYIGSLFRGILDEPESKSNYDIGKKLIERNIFIHLESSADKLELGYQMISKLYALVGALVF